ncbi:hypothetical protein B0I35DRAFT_516948 [Stachybotrys elegans]|uniref:Uncharacterized protein n=1 Tax=Stachybotrys elegans TaxID=80388 RepID=A0A8K0WK47_9HYPO|nr:hypothetical protein B0I35DRAFT_516948 [Stachybotrys elegans]
MRVTPTIPVLLLGAAAASDKLAEGAAKCPEKLKATVDWVDYEWSGVRHLTMAGLHDHLKACHNTAELNLHLDFDGAFGLVPLNFPFNLAGGDRYPNLTSLKVNGYNFDSRPWDELLATWNWNLLKIWLGTPKERRYMSNIELWLEAMDWSHLESLDMGVHISDHLAEVIPPHLTNLKHLTFSQSNMHLSDGSLKFIQSLASSVLDKHGSSLKNLDIHYDDRDTPLPQLTSEEFHLIDTKALNLQHLALNIDRNGTWPWEALEIIASSLPSLESVHIWLQLASDLAQQNPPPDFYTDQEAVTDSAFREPRLNQTTAAEVFTFLKARNGDGSLQSVTFSSGDFIGGPARFSQWDYGRRPALIRATEIFEPENGEPAVIQ